MDLRALLLKLYFNVESAYYEFLDALDNYAPVYKTFVNPIEDAGYPSFPVYSILLVVALAVLFFFSHAVQPTGTLVLTVQDTQGAVLPGATVLVFTTTGSDSALQVAAGVSDFTGRVGFVGIPVKPLRLQVSRQGYVSKSVPLEGFSLSSTGVIVSLEPTADTVSQAQVQNEARQQLAVEIERLKRDGHPEFAEAIQGEVPPVDG